MSEGRTAQAIADLTRAEKSVSDSGQKAASMLTGMGMTNSANSVNQVCQNAHDATNKGCESAFRMDEVYQVLMYSRYIVEMLEEKFAPALAAAGSALSDLEGLDEGNWSGTGSKAYSRYSGKQSKAAAELSAATLKLTALIRDSGDAAQAMSDATNLAIMKFGGELLGSCVALIPPLTPAGVIGIISSISYFIYQVVTINAEYKSKQARLCTELDQLKRMGPDPGTSVFTSGKWPDKKLY